MSEFEQDGGKRTRNEGDEDDSQSKRVKIDNDVQGSDDVNVLAEQPAQPVEISENVDGPALSGQSAVESFSEPTSQQISEDGQPIAAQDSTQFSDGSQFQGDASQDPYQAAYQQQLAAYYGAQQSFAAPGAPDTAAIPPKKDPTPGKTTGPHFFSAYQTCFSTQVLVNGSI